MSAQILNGNKIARDLRAELASQVATLSAAGIHSGLAVVMVGDNPASQVYVRSKVKACSEIGIYSEEIKPPADITTEGLLSVISDLNERNAIDGILVQLPLPKHIDSKKILLAIDPAKDVDGFHPVNDLAREKRIS